MQVQELSLPGVKLIRPKVFFDERGFFREMFRKPLYLQNGIDCEFVQDNHSFSKQGTIRGMHFQRAPGQSKLVTVMQGKIFDVFVDIRKNSPTFGKWEGVYLDAEHGDQLFIPAGYAHGFCVVSETVHLVYKVSSIFDPAEEFTFRFDDPSVGIQWPVEAAVISDRDRIAPLLNEVIK
ncbi:MAG: dTDP-4-dehydrorhamnose 3,5-epimerase [Candidatus Melainabacteria bacterium]|nr:dTDP-4-dehydrorhamnose 3,5-epimerase [Candidatus Melainabacteria bacterium]